MGTSSSSLSSSIDRFSLSDKKYGHEKIKDKSVFSWTYPADTSHIHSASQCGHNILNPLSMVKTTQCSSITPPPLPILPEGSSIERSDGNNKNSTIPPSESSYQSSQDEFVATNEISRSASTVSPLSNPGLYENVLIPIKRLTNIETHDGFRCEIHKQLSPFMVAIHSFWLGTTMIPDGRMKTYTFSTQVANEDGLLMTRYDPDMGSIDGRVHKSLLNGFLQTKIQLGVSSERVKDQLLLECDVNSDSWTGNIKYGSVAAGNVFGLNYNQAITEQWSLGGEGMYVGANSGNWMCSGLLRYETNAESGMEDELSIPNSNDCATKETNMQHERKKYSSSLKGKSIFIAQYDPTQNGLGLYYNRIIVPDRVVFGAELLCNPPLIGGILGAGPGPGEGDCTVALGTEFQLTRSKMNISVDGTGRIKSTLEAKLGMAMGSPSISFSADIDHGKDVMKFGYGLSVGG